MPATSPNDAPARVLIIDDEPMHAEAVAEGLHRRGFDCTLATTGRQGADLIDRQEFEVVLTDLRMSDIDGLAIVRKVREASPTTEVIVITGHGDVRTAVEAIKLGASQYLIKPVNLEELRAIVAKASERPLLSRANEDLRRQLDERFGFEGILGNSSKMHKVVEQLKAYAPTAATVLILGENGTGKELVAKSLHNNSSRKNKPFVAMNCAALNENLLDDEMFGHEPGAFTGAEKMRKGRFEAANGGTLFLDEVGDMPLALQAKLLRVLENGEIVRIGSNDPIKIDVRLIAATNRDLRAMIAEGKFREDLFYRLNVLTLRLPSLRERIDDLEILTAHFIRDMNERYGKNVSGLSEGLRKAFRAYEWPGNVRELRNVIERMVIIDADGILGIDDMPEGEPLRELVGISGIGEHAGGGPDFLIGRPLSEVERYYSEKALEMAGGNREVAAKMLGIGERTLYRNFTEWKLQDQIRAAIAEAGGDIAAAARALDMTEDKLERKLKKLAIHNSDEASEDDRT